MGAAAGFWGHCLHACAQQGLPPTINVSEQDPEIPIDVVAEGFRVGKVDVVVNNAFRFLAGIIQFWYSVISNDG